MYFSGLHSEPTTRGEVAPVRIKKMKKTNKACEATRWGVFLGIGVHPGGCLHIDVGQEYHDI
jgi:hypothetical protein